MPSHQSSQMPAKKTAKRIEGKSKKKKPKAESYKIYIYKVLKQVHPEYVGMRVVVVVCVCTRMVDVYKGGGCLLGHTRAFLPRSTQGGYQLQEHEYHGMLVCCILHRVCPEMQPLVFVVHRTLSSMMCLTALRWRRATWLATTASPQSPLARFRLQVCLFACGCNHETHISLCSPLFSCTNTVRLILPGELAKHAVSEGTKAVTKFTAV